MIIPTLRMGKLRQGGSAASQGHGGAESQGQASRVLRPELLATPLPSRSTPLSSHGPLFPHYVCTPCTYVTG